MQNQNYVPLGNLLKYQAAHCSDKAAQESIEAQFAYLSFLHNNQMPIAELTRRIERLEALKAKHGLRIVDNRRRYMQQTDRAVSKLCGVAA